MIYEIREHVVESSLDLAVTIPYFLEVRQPVDIIFFVDQWRDIQDGALQQILVILVDHQHSILFFLLGHA